MIQSRRVGQFVLRRKLVHFRSGFSTSRVNAIRPPGRRCGVGDGVSGGGGDADGTTARSDGDGVTTDVKRRSPAAGGQPATHDQDRRDGEQREVPTPARSGAAASGS